TFFFFFKQKTAYEMIWCWSSDVCSSDLVEHRHVVEHAVERPHRPQESDAERDGKDAGVQRGGRLAREQQRRREQQHHGDVAGEGEEREALLILTRARVVG